MHCGDQESAMLRLLLSHCLAPTMARMRSWLLTARVEDGDSVSSAATTSRPGGRPPTWSAAAQGPGWSLPAFLQPLRHQFEQSGKQMRLLCELEPSIGRHISGSGCVRKGPMGVLC